MDKTLVLMGVVAMIIGVGFGAFGLVDYSEKIFWQSAAIWTVGGITLILGLTVFAKEEGFLEGR